MAATVAHWRAAAVPLGRGDGRAELAPSGVDPGLLLEREDVAGEDRERRAHVPRGCQ